jgi:hypothetical protein
MTKDDFISIVEHYVPVKPDRESVLSAAWDYSEALIAAKPIVSGSAYSKADLERAFTAGASNAAKLRVSGNKLTLPVLEFEQWYEKHFR